MTLSVELNGAEEQLEFHQDGETFRFRFGARTQKVASLRQAEPGVYSVLIEGQSYEARVEQTLRALLVAIGGCRFEVVIRDPRRWNREKQGRRSEGRESLIAPMPGKIVRLLVSRGDRVAAGQAILVVEAMKMQNEMKASRAGRVADIPVREGANVSAGEVLATIE